MHPALAEQLQPFGGIIIDYVDHGPDQRGFTIGMKNKPTGVDCGGCPSGQTCDSEAGKDSPKS